jgi:hypothetical protein
MKRRQMLGLVAAVFTLVAVGASPAARAEGKGLYADKNKDSELTKGDIANQDYWFAKFDNMMLDLAIDQHQPEGKIGLELVSSIERLKKLSEQYPKHEEIKKWKEHAEEVQKKIDPNAPRNVSFNPGCPWDESNFAQLWVNWHYGKMLYEAKDYNLANTMFSNVAQNYEIMLKKDRMKEYPEDLRKWVEDSKAEFDKMYAASKKHTNR